MAWGFKEYSAQYGIEYTPLHERDKAKEAAKDNSLLRNIGTTSKTSWGDYQQQQEKQLKSSGDKAMSMGDFAIMRDADYGAGNIDMNRRPKVVGPDGATSTVRSMSINEDGKEILIPTVRFGLDRPMTNQEAIDWYHQTGEHLGVFDTPKEATKYAEKLHKSEAAKLAGKPKSAVQAPRKANVADSFGHLTERVASGITFGATDFINKQIDKGVAKLFGVDVEDIPKEEIEYSKPVEIAGDVLDIAGGLVSGGGVLKGLGKAVGPTVGKVAGKALSPLAKAGEAVGQATPQAVKIVAKKGAGVGGAYATYQMGKGATTPIEDVDPSERTGLTEFGASLREGTGTTVGLLGSHLDRKGYEELAEKVKTTGENISKGYETGQVNYEDWKTLLNPQWWTKNFAKTLPTTAALIPAMFIAYKAGAKTAAVRGFGKFGQVVIGSLAGSVASRPLESAMEAAATFEETGDHEAAERVYRDNLKLAGLDAAQLAIAFAPVKAKPIAGAFAKAGKAGIVGTKLGKVGIAGAKLATVGITEGGEEGYQEAVQARAEGKDARSLLTQMIYRTPEMEEAMAMGAIIGIGMGGAGVINDVFTKAEEVDSEIQKRVVDMLPPEMQVTLAESIANFQAQGHDEGTAIRLALDELASTNEGQQIIATASKQVAEEMVAEATAEQESITAQQAEKPATGVKIDASMRATIEKIVKSRTIANLPDSMMLQVGQSVVDRIEQGMTPAEALDATLEEIAQIPEIGEMITGITQDELSQIDPTTLIAQDETQQQEKTPPAQQTETEPGKIVYDKESNEPLKVISTQGAFFVVENEAGERKLIPQDEVTEKTPSNLTQEQQEQVGGEQIATEEINIAPQAPRNESEEIIPVVQGEEVQGNVSNNETEPAGGNMPIPASNELYHGTNQEGLENIKGGSWFTPNKDMADKFASGRTKEKKGKANTYSVKVDLSSKNLADISKFGIDDYVTPKDIAQELGIPVEEVNNAFLQDIFDENMLDSPTALRYITEMASFTELLKAKGFDGIKAKEGLNAPDDYVPTYKLFDEVGLKTDSVKNSAPISNEEVQKYADNVIKTGEVKSVTLVGSTVTKGKGNDVDILYDLGEMELPADSQEAAEQIESFIENMQAPIDLDLYDAFIKVGDRYFHLQTGAGREIVENTDYAKEQAGKPSKVLAQREAETNVPQTKNQQTEKGDTKKEYPSWKLDIIANDLKGISTDHRIIRNVNLLKKMYSDKKLSAKEILTLFGEYIDEFEQNNVYVGSGYNEWAIKERFEAGRENIKRDIWDKYVSTREDSIQSTIEYKQREAARDTIKAPENIEPVKDTAPKQEEVKSDSIKVGDTVYGKQSGTAMEVLSVDNEAGSLRVKSSTGNIVPIKIDKVSREKPVKGQKVEAEAKPVSEQKAEPVKEVVAEKADEQVQENEVKQEETITDRAKAQEIKNSIAEGEMILKSGKSAIGREMSAEELDGVRRSVESSKAKIGDTSPTPDNVVEQKEPKEKTPKTPKKAPAKPAITDFGEKIGGAKKDRWAERNLSAEDLASLTDREADKFVTKDNIWKKIDYAAMVDEGVPVHVAYLIKKMRDALPAKVAPTTNEETNKANRERYIELVEIVRDVVMNIKTEADLQGVFEKIFVKNGYYEYFGDNRGRGSWTPKGKANASIENKLIKAVSIRSYDIIKVKRDVEKTGWPGKVEAWRKNVAVRQSTDGDWFITKDRQILADGFDTQEAAEAYLETELKEKLKKAKRVEPEIPQLANIERTGIDYRKGKDVTGEDLLKVFGFRGGEFGNWNNQAERQASLNYAYDALMDLADLLGISPKDISLDGQLGIAFGARGSGRALAHYEPSKIVINLTKMKGAGSLAHEWFHAVDDHIGRLSGDTTSLYSESGGTSKSKLPEAVRKAFSQLLDAVRYIDKTPEDIVADGEKALKRYLRNIDYYIKPLVNSLSKEQETYAYDRKQKKRVPVKQRAATEKELAQFQKYVDDLKEGKNIEENADKMSALYKSLRGRVIDKEELGSISQYARFTVSVRNTIAEGKSGKATGRKKSNYVENAAEIDSGRSKGYWSRIEELLARAFAAFTEDSIAERSQYLVHSSHNSGIYGDYKPYPEGKERENINKAMDNLFKVFVNEGIMQKGEPPSDLSKTAVSFKLDIAGADTSFKTDSVTAIAKDLNLTPAPEAMEQEIFQAANTLSQIFTGNDIVTFKGKGIQGMAEGDTIYLNQDAKDPVLYVAKHEIVHTLEKTDPETHDKLLEIVQKYFDGNPEMAESYRKQGYSDVEIWGEFTADAVSEVMEEKGFWQMVREQAPEVIQAVIDVLDQIITRFKKAVAKDNSMLKYISDLESFKAEVAGVTAETLSKPKRRNVFDMRTDKEVAAKAKQGQGNFVASFTNEKISQLYEAFSVKETSKHQDYAQRYVAYITPEEFISLTTPADSVEVVKSEAAEKYGNLDVGKMADVNSPMLIIDADTGQVTGHEGRHRMALMQKEGIGKVAITIESRPSEQGKYSRKKITNLRLTGQEFDSGRAKGRVTLSEAIPLSNRYRAEVYDKFGEKAKAEVRYKKGRVKKDIPGSFYWSEFDHKGKPDLAVEGANKIHQEGLTDYAEWSKAMTKEFGDDASNRLSDLWRRAQALAKNMAKREDEINKAINRTGSDYVARRETPSGVTYEAASEEERQRWYDEWTVPRKTRNADTDSTADRTRERGRISDNEGSPFRGIGMANTNTDNFKKWFGDSKVVDEKGIPLVVYHGTGTDFNVFDTTKTKGMIWLTDNKDYAAEFASKGQKPKDLYASIQNPIDASQYTEEYSLQHWQEVLTDLGVDTKKIDWNKIDFAPKYGEYFWYDLFPHAGNNYADGGTINAIREAGYDGMITPVEATGDIQSGKTFVAFSSNQVKSTDNRGTWDVDSSDIRLKRERSPLRGIGTDEVKLKRAPQKSSMSLPDVEVQEAFEAANGTPQSTLMENMTEGVKEFGRIGSRVFEWLPAGERFAPLKNALLKLRKAKSITSHETVEKIESIVKGLNPQQYNAFRYKVVFDDIAAGIRAGEITENDQLPFNLTLENFERNKEYIDQQAESMPGVMKAIEKRKEIWADVTERFITAQRDVGFNVEEKLTREDYYRHQILDHARNKAALFGSGDKLKVHTSRGFLRSRTQSGRDFNTDYLQAEYEVMAQMLHDIEPAKVIKMVKDKYDIISGLKEEAAKRNTENMLAYFESIITDFGVNEDAAGLYRQTLNKKQAKALNELYAMAAKGELPLGANNKYESIVEKMAGEHFESIPEGKELFDHETKTELTGDLFVYLNYLTSGAEVAETVRESAKKVMVGAVTKERTIKQTLGKEYVKWEDLVPEGYSIYRPREGNMFYNASAIPEGIATMLAEDIIEIAGVSKDMIHSVLAVGSKYPPMVVPDEVALTVEALHRDPALPPGVIRGYRMTYRGWKQWQLVSPRRFFKYNVRNITGDLDAVLAGNPSSVTKVAKAWKELKKAFLSADKQMSPEVRNWFERGGFDSLFQIQEISDINYQRKFRQIMDDKLSKEFAEKNILQKTGKMGQKAWYAYWDGVNVTTNFREALLRYATYLDYLEQMQSNSEGKPKNWGASKREEIMALDDIRDRAAKMANELLGAYDQVSVVGQGLADNLFPFWRWQEVNFVRYKQLMINAWVDGATAKAIAGKATGLAIKSPLIAWNVSKFLLKASMLTAIITAWNLLFFPDEEDELSDSIKGRLHIVLGRDKNGEIRYFSRLGAMQDFLDWFGLDTPVQLTQDFLNGKTNLKETLVEIGKEDVSELVNSLSPFLTLPAELVTGYKFFPDVFKPGRIRDSWFHVFDSFALGDEYRALTGMPSKGYSKSLDKLFVYKSNSYETAYWATMDEKRRFQKEIGKYTEGYISTPRTEPLYNLKLAIRYGDQKAAEKYMAQYIAAGGTPKGLATSLRNMHPLHGLSKADKAAFLEYLDEDGKRNLAKAEEYYDEVIKGSSF